MTRKKRLRRDRLNPRPAPPSPTAGTTVVIPSAGPRAFSTGWSLSWAAFFDQARRPFALVRLFLVVLVVFSLIRMSLAYAVNLVGFGADGASPEVIQVLNQALWNAFGFLLGPAALTPWFAARTLFFHRLRVPWRLVMEPLGAPWRWAHLLGLGAVWMASAAVVGAHSSWLASQVGVKEAFLILAGLWMASQVVFSVAAASVWRDETPAHLALLHGLVFPLRGASALAGMGLAWVGQVLVLALVVLIFLGLPVAYLHWSGYNLRLVALLFIPAFVLLGPWVFHQRAVMAMALLDWGQPRVKPLDSPF